MNGTCIEDIHGHIAAPGGTDRVADHCFASCVPMCTVHALEVAEVTGVQRRDVRVQSKHEV